jgi:hypothetical protein
MLHFFKFHSEVQSPVPARDVYLKHRGGRGWPEECPPLRTANAFGWDVLATFPMTFTRRQDGAWRLEQPIDVRADWAFVPREFRTRRPTSRRRGAAAPAVSQRNAWFWEKRQILPHRISDAVWKRLRNQVKVSTFLYLATDEEEILLITDVPNLPKPYRAMSAIVETDWYPASYPWHCVLELDPKERKIEIPAGAPLCRLIPLRRDRYTARAMTHRQFDDFFRRGQDWLARHGKGPPSEMMDITGAYVRQQRKSRFTVVE